MMASDKMEPDSLSNVIKVPNIIKIVIFGTINKKLERCYLVLVYKSKAQLCSGIIFNLNNRPINNAPHPYSDTPTKGLVKPR